MRGGKLVYTFQDNQSNTESLTETFLGGMPAATAGDPAITGVTFFLGNDPGRWQENLPSFDELRLGEVWRGISVSLRARSGNIEKIFRIQPKAQVMKIDLRVEGASRLELARDGALIAATASGEVRFTAPVAYQDSRDGRHPVDVAYVLHGSTYGFRLGRHDPALPVVIDPILQSTYVGGEDPDSVNAMAVDPRTGDVIVAGHSYSNPGRGAVHGVDGFVARYDSTLKTLLHFTFIGGSGGDEITGVAFDPATGDVYVAGYTTSADFPGTSSGAQTSSAGSEDGFIAMLDSTLTQLHGATYYGGSSTDKIAAIGIHPVSGEIFVAGSTNSADLPGTVGSAGSEFIPDSDFFLARFDPTLKTLTLAMYVTGGGGVLLNTMAIHPSTGEILVAGNWSTIGRVDPSLGKPPQFTQIGSEVFGIAVEPHSGDIFVAGWTQGLPGADGGAQPQPGGVSSDVDGFVARFDSTLTTLRQATYLGGADNDYAYGIAVHPSSGDIYVTGETLSTDLPATSGAAQSKSDGGFDGFVARLNPTLTRFVQVTYLGGYGDDTPHVIAVHPVSGEILVAGETTSPDLPSVRCSARSSYAGGAEFLGGDGFVSLLSADLGAKSAQAPEDSCGNSRDPILLPPRLRHPRTTLRSARGGASSFSERRE